jgi:hypothetical protein
MPLSVDRADPPDVAREGAILNEARKRSLQKGRRMPVADVLRLVKSRLQR